MASKLRCRDASRTPRVIAVALMVITACTSTVNGDSAHAAGQAPVPTLDGKPPLVIAHRGASGYLPEETLEAFQLAIDQGADVIEFDLISTKDGALIARHDPDLAISTDVASRPEFADRKRVGWLVDGEKQTGWFAHDFTLAEIKTLGGRVTDAERPHQNDGKLKIATLQEIIDLAKAQSAKLGRSIAIYPETKNPTYHRELGLPLEGKLIAALEAAGWNSRSAPVFVQSFEPGSIREMRAKGLRTRAVQLIDGNGIDYATGRITYKLPEDRPYDWTRSGDQRLFSAMVTPAGLAEIRTYADGIGPWKPYIVPVRARLDAAGRPVDSNGDGRIDLRDASTQPATTLVADAHAAGLFVHPYTFRSETRRLAKDYDGDPKAEYLQFYRLGVDGVFSDFPDTAVAVRAGLFGEAKR